MPQIKGISSKNQSVQTINFLSVHFIPEHSVGTDRIVALTKEMGKSNKVNIITLSEKGIIPDERKVIYSKNITVHYIYQKDYPGKHFYKRAYYEMKYCWRLLHLSRAIPCDKTIVTIPYMFLIPTIGFGISGTKILDIRDLMWEYLEEKNLQQKTIKYILRILMKFGIKRFDHIIVTNQTEKNFLSTKYHCSNVSIVPNGIDKKRYESLAGLKQNKTIPFTVTFAGTIGFGRNLMTLVQAAKELPNIQFLIIGDGIELTNLKKYANSLYLDNIKFTGKIAFDDLVKFYQKSSVLFAELDRNIQTARPSKLYEYASTGLPIIYSGIGEGKYFVQNLENTIVIAPDSTTELVHAIKNIKSKKISISKYNKKLIKEKYLREYIAQKHINKFT